MTDDITHGLTALADEAQPAPIDSHTVIQLAHAHSRARRAVYAAAFATLVAIGALTVAIGSWQQPEPTHPVTSQTTSESAPSEKPPTRDPDSPPTEPEVRDTPTAEENAARKPRLQTEMVAAFDRILPDGWEHSAFGFGCDQTGCFAEGDVIDDKGTTLSFFVYVSGSLGTSDCYEPNCVRAEVLDDGTAVQLSKSEHEVYGGSQKERTLSVDAQRPDSTMLSMLVTWPADKQTPALTDEQWMEFGKALTY